MLINQRNINWVSSAEWNVLIGQSEKGESCGKYSNESNNYLLHETWRTKEESLKVNKETPLWYRTDFKEWNKLPNYILKISYSFRSKNKYYLNINEPHVLDTVLFALPRLLIYILNNLTSLYCGVGRWGLYLELLLYNFLHCFQHLSSALLLKQLL